MNGLMNLSKDSSKKDAANARVVLERIPLPSSKNRFKITDESIAKFINRDKKMIESANCFSANNGNSKDATESSTSGESSSDFNFDVQNIMTLKDSLLILQRIPLPNKDGGGSFNIKVDPIASFVRQDRKKILKLQMERNSLLLLMKPSIDSTVPETYTNRPDIKNFKSLFRRKKGSGQRYWNLSKGQRRALALKKNSSYSKSVLSENDKKIVKCMLCDKKLMRYKLDQHLSKIHDEDNPDLW